MNKFVLKNMVTNYAGFAGKTIRKVVPCLTNRWGEIEKFVLVFEDKTFALLSTYEETPFICVFDKNECDLLEENFDQAECLAALDVFGPLYEIQSKLDENEAERQRGYAEQREQNERDVFERLKKKFEK